MFTAANPAQHFLIRADGEEAGDDGGR